MRVRGFRVRKSTEIGDYRLTDVFGGLEFSSSLLKAFGSKSELGRIMRHLKLRLEPNDSGPWFDRDTGTICIGTKHINGAKPDFLYLDMIHVLVHVCQFLEGRDLYDQAFEYVERPTELEAYRFTVAEARKVGLDETEILRYLRVGSDNDSDLGKLMDKIGVRARR